MSLTRAELNNTGCWLAAAHGAVRSCRAVARDEFVSSTRVRTTRGAAIIPRFTYSVRIAGRSPRF
jgi:hypothetical protein